MATITSANNHGYWISGNGIGFHLEYTHDSRVDGTNVYGKCNGFPRRNIFGGDWKENTSCGSRCAATNCNTARVLPEYS